MSYTDEQKEKMRQKEAALPDALKRDALSNYFEGYFFVTLNTRDESPILSTIRGHVGGEGKDAPHCEYTELGSRVKKVIASIPNFHTYAEVIDAEVMPEHLHMLLYLRHGGKEHLGRVIGGFMIGCSHAYWDTLGIDWRKDHPSKGQPTRSAGLTVEQRNAAALKRAEHQDPDHTRSFRGPALFVHGYNDVEPITEEAVKIKIEYIRKQAEKRLIQGDRHECFRVFRNQHSQNWTREVVLRSISNDAFFGRTPGARDIATQNVLKRTEKDGFTLSFIGNRQIMANPNKLPLICHRADAWRFEQQKATVIDAARKGWIIVSAFISPKERDIKEQLMVEQLPFIEIMDNGFSDRYKPKGKAFYACGENRLVQISCWNYLYQKEMKISREMCLVMNELARVICKRADDWWKACSKNSK